MSNLVGGNGLRSPLKRCYSPPFWQKSNQSDGGWPGPNNVSCLRRYAGCARGTGRGGASDLDWRWRQAWPPRKSERQTEDRHRHHS